MSKLTIIELYELIKDLSDDSEVMFTLPDGCCGDLFYLENVDADIYGTSSSPYLNIHLVDGLPGYRSCIQSGQTKRNDELYWKKVKGEKE